MFDKVLVANRGEIACGIIRTLKRMGVATVAVYAEADRHASHVLCADEAVCIGNLPAAQSYRDIGALVDAMRDTGAQAVHPGYGCLAGCAEFAHACAEAGVRFIGPSSEHLRVFGRSDSARQLARAFDLPVLPVPLAGARHADRADSADATNAADSAGSAASAAASAQAGEDDIDPDNFAEGARHIEVQIFGDGAGTVAVLGERDCSVRRGGEAMVVETPAPRLSDVEREALHAMAARFGQAVRYESAGTVTFLFDVAARRFYFLGMTAGLQAGYGVTEEVAGIDLVEWMVRQAAGMPRPASLPPAQGGGAGMQAYVYAQDPNKQFLRQAGVLTHVAFAPQARIDGWIEAGTELSAGSDALLAKVIVRGATRAAALQRLREVLDESRLSGIETTLDYLRTIAGSDTFVRGCQTTGFLGRLSFAPHTVDVLDGGMQTTVQDVPGRLGYWDIGVPPSGPMDGLAFRLANALLGNPPDSAGLEFTMTGATLRFNFPALFVLGGAAAGARLDGEAISPWQVVRAPAGAVLKVGGAGQQGLRGYLAVKDGIVVPDYLGSKSTFTLGQFGGHAGRALRRGDVLHLAAGAGAGPEGAVLDVACRPVIGNAWQLAVLDGPHGAPDFLTPADMAAFYAARWVVHHNSSRTGIRLIGPRPAWARSDGGEAGLHPSNIHDNAYTVGAVDFTGDMPVILGPDGPSLGGFVCPVTVIHADLWKLGQLRPGDTVSFRRVSIAQAEALEAAQARMIADLTAPPAALAAPAVPAADSCVLHRDPSAGAGTGVVYRQSGDKAVLIEYGPPVLDLNLRFRVHALMHWLQARQPEGILDLTPGIRSLQVHFDNRSLPRARLLDLLAQAETELPAVDAIRVPNRIVHLPLSWDDPSTRLAIERYTQSVRPDAPWCPSNIEFIRRINGLDSIDDVRRIVFEARYLVLGLGDVYLGAPVATPLDPRHRLVTTKYNPARTWTPENAVGIGGAYMCVYGMEGPGGYQFVGRTVQMWNRYRSTGAFEPGKPWLLRFFDEIRFYPVSEAELADLRADFVAGRAAVRIEPSSFDLGDYNRFLHDNAPGIQAFRTTQRAAFHAERERWRDTDGRQAVAETVEENI